MHQQAAHRHANIDERRLPGGHGSGFDSLKLVMVFRQRSGAAAAEAGKAFGLDFGERLHCLAAGIDLADLDNGVEHALALAVEDLTGDADVLARRMRLRQHRGEQAFEVVAVLPGAQAVGEERADGLRGGLLELRHDGLAHSNRLAWGPRKTMSNT